MAQSGFFFPPQALNASPLYARESKGRHFTADFIVFCLSMSIDYHFIIE